MTRLNPFARIALLSTLATGVGNSAEVVLLPSDDTAIYADTDRVDSNAGLSPQIPAGARSDRVTPEGATTRILIRFDVAAEIPAGATIDSATIGLHLAKTPPNERSSTFGLHRMLVPWIEGRALVGNEGAGPAQSGEPTWNNRAHPNTPWGAPGGLAGTDFIADPGATRLIPAGTSPGKRRFSFSSAGLAELQAMLDQPAANHGWILISDRENTLRTARLWTSKDVLTQDEPTLARRPDLTIEFTPPAPSPPADFRLSFNTGSTRTLNFTADPGSAYQIESSTSLLPTEWSLLESIPSSPSGGPRSVTIPAPFPNRQFFRISNQ